MQLSCIIEKSKKMDKRKKFAEIKEEVKHLKISPLYNFRIENDYQPVVGAGSLDAKLMFIGEAPGKNEAEKGKPFIGQAGKVLDELLKSVGLERSDVYITSVLFDRPPGNRNPKSDEIKIYKPYLLKLIKLIKPQIIATLGTFAAKTITNHFNVDDKFSTIGKDHGKKILINSDSRSIIIFPMYHPAAVLYNRTLQKQIEEDFVALKKVIER